MAETIPTPAYPPVLTPYQLAKVKRLAGRLDGIKTYTVLKVWNAERERYEAGDPDLHVASDGIIADGARYWPAGDPTPAPGTPLCILDVCGNLAEYEDPCDGRLYCRHDKLEGMPRRRGVPAEHVKAQATR